MEKRHENALKDTLETVYNEGFASLSKWKITSWYGQSNFTVTIRRDLRERWKSLAEEEYNEKKPPVLRIAEVNDGRTVVFMKKVDFWPDAE